ncbi:MAG: ABC transporter permease [bacterium]|nr:ABC transporter permease [bacterium]
MNRQVIGAMVRLRLLRVVRDRGGLVWLLVMPMVFSYLMGMLMGDWSGSSQPARRKLLVSDLDGGPAVSLLLGPLRANDAYEVAVVDTAFTDARARELVDARRATAVLQVPPGFSAALAGGPRVDLRLTIDGDRLGGQAARTLVEGELARLATAGAAMSLVAPPGTPVPRDGAASFDEGAFVDAWESPRVRLRAATLGRLESEDWGLTRSHQHVGPSYVLFFVLMFMMVSAKDLVQERRDRTLARLVTSRASAVDLVAGYFLGGMAVGLLQAAILLVLNAVAFKLDYGDAPLALAAVVVLFAAFSSSAAILLGTLARSGAQADGLGTGLTMVMAAIGGLWWPLEVVPAFMQVLGRALPTGQAISIFHGLVGRGWGLAEAAPLLGGLLLWFVAAFTLAAWRLRRQIAT